ncbi:hypothetical protein SAMN02799615_04266 [Dyella marensis]|uniref:Uncharacterized protein n=2 Tax=Rhodanobacteraceae TaxID=1775411 RepID=A0A1I2JWG8_9GAMM|nr:hypothetical protein SAMN02799615_04266 [Dyella marensis]
MRTTPVALIEFLGLARATREAATPPQRRAPGARDYQLPGRYWPTLFDGSFCFHARRPIVFLHLADEADEEPPVEPAVIWHRLH